MSKTTTQLTEGWRWRLADANGNKKPESLAALREWTPAASFPSVIQMELLAQGLIPDPYIGENERQVQWAGEVDWEYACSFLTPDSVDGREHVDLVFDGLDTFATATLNGVTILESDNMFIPQRVAAKDLLKPAGASNELTITFQSALKAGSALEKQHGARTSLMRDRRRMHTRKAQYHWGWDWGPIILTAGPYRPIYLEAYDARIEHVHVLPALADDHSSASVAVNIALVQPQHAASLCVEVLDAGGTLVRSVTVPLSSTERHVTCTLDIPAPKLWWPNGQGDQHLYTAHVRLLGGGSSALPPLDALRSVFGVRTIELVQRPLTSEPGTTFMFRVNGRDIFVQGGNWIPADMFLPNISRQRYFDWVQLAQACHLNMIRVWGGGIYETEDFLDACDAMGILVWHDYALACGDYPVHDAFVASVAKEAEVQTIRLRNRACLALLCGGNEDFMFADLLLKIDYDHADLTGPFDGQPFPQRKLYLDVLPKLAAALCPNVPYWANSPFGGAEANDREVGDIHQWNVWHGQELPYQAYKDLGGRFVSEFGMHGFPVDRTVAYFCRGAPAGERHAQSRLVDCHNKSEGAHTRIARYLAENVRYDTASLRNFGYASQLVQSEAYAYALQHWKRQFRGPGREACAGAVIWQLNDVYPCTSWAFVDYFLRPKPAYYAIKRAFAPLAVGVERSVASRWVDENQPDASRGPPSFQIWAHNTAPAAAACTLALEAYDLAAGAWALLPEEDRARPVTLEAGQSTELGRLAPLPAWPEDVLVVLEAKLVDTETGHVLARYVDWPEPYRYLTWPPDTQLTIHVTQGKGKGYGIPSGGEWEAEVTVSSNQALKGVWLEPVYDGTEAEDGREPVWQDNMFDLMPGRAMTVGVNGLKGRDVKARFLADWEVGRESTAEL